MPNHLHSPHDHATGPGHHHQVLSRRTLLKLAGAAGVSAALSPLLVGCGDSGASGNAGTGALRIGYLPITDAAPLLVALGKGYYRDEGVDVAAPTLFRGWDAITESVRSGRVDIAHLLMPTALQLRAEKHARVKVVAWNHMNGSALTLATDGRPLAESGGSTIAIPFWYSIHNISLQILLAKHGLTPIASGTPTARQVRLVVMAPSDMVAGLVSGAIAGYIVAEPFNAMAEVKGIGRIERFTGDVWKNHACCVLVVSEDLIGQRPEVLQGAITAIARAQLFLENDRKAGAALLTDGDHPYLPQPPAAVERTLTDYDSAEYRDSGAIIHPEWGINRIDYQPFPFPSFTEELVKRLDDTLVQPESTFLGRLDPAGVHTDLVDDRFARVALRAVGGPEAFGLDASLTRTEVIDA